MAVAARRIGISRLHNEQKRVIEDVLEGKDVLMVLPTGFGKSACYQVPSMLLEKPTVVISPLLALLKDQHTSMLKHGIDCVRLDGSVRGKARREALERIAEGGPLLVMTTPETLSTSAVKPVLAEAGIGLAAVDEAHCISEWGHDFRPAYQRLGAVLRQMGSPPILALTATATDRVREGIVRSLAMRDPSVVAASPHRSNLAFEVLSSEGDLRPRALVRLIQRLRRPGIVYCSTRRDVDELYALLKRFGVPAHRYHGGMLASERNLEQARFMKPRTRTVMIATSAFGLGIDKPDIRYVLHYQAPAALEQYVQEAGRAGRDGKKANCILLADPAADRQVHEALLSRSRIRPDQLYRLAVALAHWGEDGQDPTIEGLALSAELGPRACAALLATLEEAELVEREDKEVRLLVPHDRIEEEARALAGRFETLRTQDGRRLDVIGDYTKSDLCRAVYLRRYFGEEDDQPCNLCDVCRGRSSRPESFFAPLARPASGRKRKAGRKKKASRKGSRKSSRKAAGRRGSGRKRSRKKSARRSASANGEGDASELRASQEGDATQASAKASARKKGRSRGRRRGRSRGRRRSASPEGGNGGGSGGGDGGSGGGGTPNDS